MRRADRLFEIIQRLRRRRVVTASSLAEQFKVSERTIYRDIRDLIASKVPIEGAPGIGYSLRKGYDLPPLMFSESELEALVFGIPLAYQLQPYVSDGWTLFFGLAYTIHVPLFFIPALLHWRRGSQEQAERLLLTLALAMYIGFVGYALFPALGPVGALPGLRPVGGNLATQTVANYAVALGTFPSLHAGVSSAVAIDAWRTSRRWGVAFTVVAGVIWISTIYLRYHWVPDLLAGALLAVVCTWLAVRLQARRPRAM